MVAGAARAEPHALEVDFAVAQGELRALHGINKGPLAPNGLVDLTEAQARLRVPSTRLHDCHHPNPAVVDIHAVFPNPEADPALPGSYDFRATDEYIAAVRATGAEVIYRLGESIEHQTVKRHVFPPRDPARWAETCAGIVRHYNEEWAGGFRYGIRYWEVWNEPNIFFWQGPPDMYAELLRQAYAAIKQANPDAVVLGCSTSGVDLRFIRRTMELGAPFDVLTVHPYRSAMSDGALVRDLTNVAAVVAATNGVGRPVWITEIGWGTHVSHNSFDSGFPMTSERQQAEFLVRAYVDALVAASNAAATRIIWYDFRNDGTDPLYFEQNMGIVHRDFRPKPAYRAYATLTRALADRPTVRPLSLGEGIVAYEFRGQSKPPAIVVWAADSDRTVTVPSARPLQGVNLMGEVRPMRVSNGQASLVARRGVPLFLLPVP